MDGQIDQIFDLARAQTCSPHVVDLEFQHIGRDHFFGQHGKPVPNGLGGFDRNLLPHNAACQRGEGVTTGAEADVGELRNQALHDPVFFTQMFAGIRPVAWNDHLGCMSRCSVVGRFFYYFFCSNHVNKYAGQRPISLLKSSLRSFPGRPGGAVFQHDALRQQGLSDLVR